jgi:hypothetical protein
MTPEQQRTAIAEACGFYDIVNGYSWVEFKSGQLLKKLPDYLNDLNAMHEAEKVLNANQRINFACYLTEPVRDRIYNVIQRNLNYDVCFPALHATAAQRAEAFLRTIGKWEDGKMSPQCHDGGPAFPIPDSHHANGQVQYGAHGMSLRDYFAGQALAGLITEARNSPATRDDIAAEAYMQADSLLAVRAEAFCARLASGRTANEPAMPR